MSINLKKGGCVNLSKENSDPKKIQIGLGWDTNQSDIGTEFDLDGLKGEKMKIDKLVKAIKEQQIECSNQVYINILTEEEIKKLLLEGNYFYTKKDGELLVASYIKLLSKKHKIYRIGGLTVSNAKNPLFHTKREVIKIIAKLKRYVLKHNINFIIDTNTISLESFFLDMGAKKLSFEECLEQYPLFLKLYIDDAIEDREFFKSRNFYVREAKQ